MSEDYLKQTDRKIWNDWKWLVKLHLIGFPIAFFIILTGLDKILPLWLIHVLFFPAYVCIITWMFFPVFGIFYLLVNAHKL